MSIVANCTCGKEIYACTQKHEECPNRQWRENLEKELAQKRAKTPKPKPQFYSVVFAPLQAIARDLGYNLVLHGSMNRDFDLIAIPWVNEPKSHKDLIYAICDYLGAQKWENEPFPYGHGHSVLPGGRDAYVIDLNRNGKYNGWVDAEYYLDISITPLPTVQECDARDDK